MQSHCWSLSRPHRLLQEGFREVDEGLRIGCRRTSYLGAGRSEYVYSIFVVLLVQMEELVNELSSYIWRMRPCCCC